MGFIQILEDFDPTHPVDVALDTVVMDWKTFGDQWGSLLFAVVNLGTNPAEVTLLTSEDGQHPSANERDLGKVSPGQQVSLALDGVDCIREYWKLVASTGDANVHTSVVYRVKALPRH